MKHIKTAILTLLAVVGLFAFTIVPAQGAFAQSAKEAVCEGIGLAGGGDGCQEPTGTNVNSIVATVVNILSFVVGVAAVIMIIIGGLRYVTSNGDSNSINTAKNTILYAIIGLVVVALAQVIVQFVLTRVDDPASSLPPASSSSSQAPTNGQTLPGAQ
jgi:hypothetical protein